MKSQRRVTLRGKRRTAAPATALVTASGVKTIPKVSQVDKQKTVATVGMVKRMLGKARENKMCSRRVLNSTVFNSAVAPGDVYSLLPQVPLGTDDYQRIGDAIQPRALYVKGDIGLNTPDQTNNKALIARVMILEQRDIKSDNNLIASFQVNALLKVNDPSTGIIDKPYDTAPYNNIMPINKTLFKVHYDRKFYLAPTNPDVSNEELTKQKRFFTAKIRCPKNLYWDSAATNPTYCKNFCPFMVIGYQYADDTGGDITLQRVIANCTSFLYYEDA